MKSSGDCYWVRGSPEKVREQRMDVAELFLREETIVFA